MVDIDGTGKVKVEDELEEQRAEIIAEITEIFGKASDEQKKAAKNSLIDDVIGFVFINVCGVTESKS